MGFGSLDLQPYVVASFATRFIEGVFMEGRPLDTSLRQALSDAGGRRLGSHTDITIFVGGKIVKFSWFCSSVRPRGIFRPYQCTHCGILRVVDTDFAFLKKGRMDVQFLCKICKKTWLIPTDRELASVDYNRDQDTPGGRWESVTLVKNDKAEWRSSASAGTSKK